MPTIIYNSFGAFSESLTYVYYEIDVIWLSDMIHNLLITLYQMHLVTMINTQS